MPDAGSEIVRKPEEMRPSVQGAGWARCYTVPQTIVFGLRRERNLTRGLDGFAGEATGGVSEDRTLRLKPEERKGPSRAAREERTFQRARDKTPRRRQACPFFGTGKGPAGSQENVSKRGNDATIPTEEGLVEASGNAISLRRCKK